MKATTRTRLATVEQRAAARPGRIHQVDLSLLADAELERLEHYAERCQAWDGTLDAWLREDLTADERLELLQLSEAVARSPA